MWPFSRNPPHTLTARDAKRISLGHEYGDSIVFKSITDILKSVKESARTGKRYVSVRDFSDSEARALARLGYLTGANQNMVMW